MERTIFQFISARVMPDTKFEYCQNANRFIHKCREIMVKLVIRILPVALVYFFGCENNVADDPDQDPTDCSVVEAYYEESVAPILTQNCIGCHSGSSPSGGLNLDDYTSVRGGMGDVLDRVNREEGSSGFMPQVGSKLTDAELSILQSFFEMECE